MLQFLIEISFLPWPRVLKQILFKKVFQIQLHYLSMFLKSKCRQTRYQTTQSRDEHTFINIVSKRFLVKLIDNILFLFSGFICPSDITSIYFKTKYRWYLRSFIIYIYIYMSLCLFSIINR